MTDWVCPYDYSRQGIEEKCKNCEMTYEDSIAYVYEVIPLEEKEFEVADAFDKSKLGGKSMLFTNNVGLFLVRNKNKNFDAISEAISWIGDASGCLPENSEIEVSGLQIILKTKEYMSDDLIKRLECSGYMYQSGTQTEDLNGNMLWYSTFFLQNPDHWDQSFEEFLKTYPKFLQKKWARYRSPRKQLYDFIEDVKRFHKKFNERWKRNETE